MNIVSIQTDILKMIYKLETHNIAMYDDSDFVIIGDKYHMYKIPADAFYMDVEKIKKCGARVSSVLLNFFRDKGTMPAISTGNIKIDGKRKMKELSCNGDLIYVDTQFLKNFDKDCTFAGTNHKSLVFVYEQGVLSGVIYPVLVKN